ESDDRHASSYSVGSRIRKATDQTQMNADAALTNADNCTADRLRSQRARTSFCWNSRSGMPPVTPRGRSPKKAVLVLPRSSAQCPCSSAFDQLVSGFLRSPRSVGVSLKL